MSIGHIRSDHGMDDWYKRQEAYDAECSYQEANYDAHKADCIALAAKIAPDYIDAADGEPLDTETWRDWLAEEAAWASQELSDAMIWAMKKDDYLTLATAILGLAAGVKK